MDSKSCIVAMLVLVGGMLHAVEFTIDRMPVSQFVDTEVSTNMAIGVADINYADLDFTFDGTPTNNLEIAFGTDVNQNGVLEAEEIETRFGWMNGMYFVENVRTWERVESERTALPQSLSINIHLDIGTSSQKVRRVTVSGASASAFGGLVSGLPPEWMWKREWNLMRVTRRGVEAPSDWLHYKASNYGFSIMLR